MLCLKNYGLPVYVYKKEIEDYNFFNLIYCSYQLGAYPGVQFNTLRYDTAQYNTSFFANYGPFGGIA